MRVPFRELLMWIPSKLRAAIMSFNSIRERIRDLIYEMQYAKTIDTAPDRGTLYSLMPCEIFMAIFTLECFPYKSAPSSGYALICTQAFLSPFTDLSPPMTYVIVKLQTFRAAECCGMPFARRRETVNL